jgi:hypothetical protein
MVRAKDAQGNPVMMVINPDSVTAITEETQSTNAASNADHGATTNNNSAGVTPGPSSTGGSSPSPPAAPPSPIQPKPTPPAPGASLISRESSTAAVRCLTASR